MSEFDDQLRDYAARFPCVRSGYCCKKRPCDFGEVKGPDDPSCKFLEVEEEIAPGVFRHRCGRYNWILENVPERVWRFMTPAFGGGCSSPLFNTDRNAVIAAMRAKND